LLSLFQDEEEQEVPFVRKRKQPSTSTSQPNEDPLYKRSKRMRLHKPRRRKRSKNLRFSKPHQRIKGVKEERRRSMKRKKLKLL
jgi:hypothetical protein